MMTQRNVPTARIILLVAVLLLMALLMFGTAPGAFGQANTSPAPLAAGGGYALLSAFVDAHVATDAFVAQQVSAPTVNAAGGVYLLLLPAAEQCTGAPCCCAHLPCIIK